MSDMRSNRLPLTMAFLVLLLTGWVYWPGQTGPALLDDRSSVLVIGNLHEHPEQALDYIFGDRSGPLGRPVSMASFVLEKLFLGDSLAMGKRLNILLHLFNGALVMWLFWLLFRYRSTPAYRWLAIVLGAAWLLSPLYVSTVLYVVQRMAMLATTFMLLSVVSYLYWRERVGRGNCARTHWLLLPVFSCAVLALLAKENAVVLAPVLLLLEALWFQCRNSRGEIMPRLRLITLAAIALGALGLLLFFVLEHGQLAAAFRHRPFTLDERLMSQTRIVWDYVGQLVWPDVAPMGLYHDDINVSTSLLDPLSTLYALLAWIAVVGLSMLAMRWRRGRYLVLGLCWFLLAQGVESTVLPLELYFEHRNYFPGIGLFLAMGSIIADLAQNRPRLAAPLCSWFALYVIWLGSLTGSQVQIWSSQPLLLLNNLNNHPQSFRANADMAVQMAELGQIEAARHYSARAYAVSTVERSGDHDIRDLALACLANRPVRPDAIDRIGRDEPDRPLSSVITVLTLARLIQDDTCPSFDRLHFADRMARIYLAPNARATASANVYLALAVMENGLHNWSRANEYIDRYLLQAPGNSRGLLMKLHFASALGKVEQVRAVRFQLSELEAQGRLTAAEQQTLALYPQR